MSRIKIDLRSATTEQFAAQLLTILRENAKGRPAAGYYPGCLESILQLEFAPKELGLNVRGGILIQPGGAVGTYGGDRGSDGLRRKFHEAANWLRQRGYIVRDHTQREDQFAEVTTDGKVVDIDELTMTFVIPRNWTHWRSEYQKSIVHLGIKKGGDEFSGSAFQIGENLFATCEHNFAGEVFVYVDGVAIPVTSVKKHSTADVAVFSLTQPQSGIQSLPVRSGSPNPGEEVAALGYPAVPRRLPTLNISVGTIESLPSSYRGDSQFIQVSIQTSGGYSGGPLIDQCGRILGVISERTFEAVVDTSIPSRAFSQVVPLAYLAELL